MSIGRFELKLNTWTFIEYLNGTGINCPDQKSPWITLAFRIPSITLPFYKRNDLGEWERLFCISAPTLIQWCKTEDISWEFHKIVLGFGVSVIYQYGY